MTDIQTLKVTEELPSTESSLNILLLHYDAFIIVHELFTKNIILETKLYNNQVLLGMSLENGSTYEDPRVNQKKTEFYSC